jgi:glycosyltransferase involved in cell wall biosynthesis
MESLIADLETNDLTVCVSQATADDVRAYLGYPPSRLVVAPNGVAWPDEYAAAAASSPPPFAEPYLYVLGTLEPRKNLALVARTLAAHPEILDRYKVVISGAPAWEDAEWVLPEATKAMAQAGRLVLTGFVPDAAKYALLRHARATIYPSFFEGFGLPVLESLSVGTPCIASVSSSIPEIGGGACRYFDPFSVADLHTAIVELDPHPPSPAERARLIAVAGQFTWEAMLARILAAAEPLILRKAGLA